MATTKRAPLEQNTVITLNSNKYRICELLSENGASCLVYLAERLADEHNDLTKVVLKEFYPLSFAQYLIRQRNNELVTGDLDDKRLLEYQEKCEGFKNGSTNQVSYFKDDGFNHSLGAVQIAESNNTLYAISDFAGKRSLSEIDYIQLSICDIAQIMVSLCNAVDCLHKQEKLHLDIKPSNIFLFPHQPGESRRIALFDFDTVTKKGHLPKEGLCSEGWSPAEQTNWRMGDISETADIYAIGAVFYWLLTGEKVPDKLPTHIMQNNFSVLSKSLIPSDWLNANDDVKRILSATLRRSPNQREKNIGVITIMCSRLEKNSETERENRPISDKIDELKEQINKTEHSEKPQVMFSTTNFGTIEKQGAINNIQTMNEKIVIKFD